LQSLKYFPLTLLLFLFSFAFDYFFFVKKKSQKTTLQNPAPLGRSAPSGRKKLKNKNKKTTLALQPLASSGLSPEGKGFEAASFYHYLINN